MSTLANITLVRNVLLSLVVTLLTGWISIPVFRRLNFFDWPGSAAHKQHDTPTPLAGGLVLLVTLLVCTGLTGLLNQPFLHATLIAVIPVFIFGLIDDYKNLPPLLKLLGQVAGSILLIQQGIYIHVFQSPEFFIHGEGQLYVWLGYLATIFWLVGITNAFNFVDSMDGLAVGLGAMAAGFFMLVTMDAFQPTLVTFSSFLVGACIGLYLFNSPPAILFLGDAGSQTLGFILGVLAILYNPVEANQATSWIVPILLLGVPIFDACLVVFSRLRGKRPIYKAGRDHTYHRLLSRGIASQRAVLLMQVGSLMLGGLAILILVQPPLVANMIFASILVLGGWLLLSLAKPE